MSENKDNIIPGNNTSSPDPDYWRSFEELHNDPAVVEARLHEFKEGVTDDFNPDKLSGLSRRKFLALVGASAALAGAGCSNYRDRGEIIPYNDRPEGMVAGKPLYYASTCTACSNACGILIKTREGRPVKIDGNPDHPVNKGKICSKGQADILNLYDPERLKTPLLNGNETSWKKADGDIIAALSGAGGKEIAVVVNKVVSPTIKKLFEEFSAKFPVTKVYNYDLFSDEVRNSAWQKSHGSGEYPLIKWNEAKVIVALESDFLGTEENKVETARLYSEGRDVDNIENFNRLYVVEGNMSLTGMNADYRLKLRPDAQYEFVMSLISELSRRGVPVAVGGGGSLNDFAGKYNIDSKKLNLLVSDLLANRGKSIVHAGRTLPENVHIAVNALNSALGNSALYRTDSYTFTFEPLTSKGEWQELINKMNNGSIAAVIHFDSNPVYHLPKDYGYASALRKVPLSVTLTVSGNETAAASKYTLPINHSFESWGDARTRNGFYSLQQPVISPIYKTRQKEAVLLTWMSGDTNKFKENIYHDYLMANWQNGIYPAAASKLNFQEFWNGGLHDGVVMVNDGSSVSTGAFKSGALNNAVPQVSGYALALRESYNIGDGRFANNGWLQEQPHPVSKIVWDNYAAVSKATADKIGVKNNDLVEIAAGGRKIEMPVFVQPGCADGTITIELGYGRQKSGTIAEGVGFNANTLLTKDYQLSPWLFTGASIRKTGGSYELISTQEHHNFNNPRENGIEERRKIIREGTVTGYKKNPGFLHEEKEEELTTLYPPHTDYKKGVKWAMSIDLNKCTGCGECVVACISENNIPVVGKEQVGKGREMHWLRVDRYYSGTMEDPKVSTQIMLCQQCDNAPCENVCPVAATTHSADGLNQMVYNRCVGTRYCSNNCPYKVRRFNYFNFRDHFNNSFQQSDIFNLVYNPEVTVRSRGVMEKCTFCIQRIMEARETATEQKKQLKGSDVTTACQDSCGTYAIQFGDMNDMEASFAKYRNHKLGYYVLEDLHTKPNVTYIAKLRNTHTEEA